MFLSCTFRALLPKCQYLPSSVSLFFLFYLLPNSSLRHESSLEVGTWSIRLPIRFISPLICHQLCPQSFYSARVPFSDFFLTRQLLNHNEKSHELTHLRSIPKGYQIWIALDSDLFFQDLIPLLLLAEFQLIQQQNYLVKVSSQQECCFHLSHFL